MVVVGTVSETGDRSYANEEPPTTTRVDHVLPGQWHGHREKALRWLLAEARWYAESHAEQDGGWTADVSPYFGPLPWLNERSSESSG